MKKLLKLIFIGLVAGLTYKFLSERDIRTSELITSAKEWIAEKAEAVEKLASAEAPSERADDNDAGPAFDDYTSSAQSNGENYSGVQETPDVYSENKPAGMATDANSLTDFNEAEEFLLDEKPVSVHADFAGLDSYAALTPAEAEESMATLAKWLSTKAANDTEKARLIFSWIATHVAYDDYGYRTGDYADVSAEVVFRNRVSVCEGYSNLFCELGRLAGLNTAKITGYAKGLSYSPGKRFSDTNHAWNAVNINGEWKLIDATWAAGYIEGLNTKKVAGRQFDDYWFFTSPDEFVFSHLPEDEAWQMIQPLVTKTQFEGMPFVFSSFFEMGFSGAQCLPAVLGGTVRQLPETYRIEGDVKVVSSPIDGSIRSGKTIRVLVRSGDAVRIAYKSQGSITDMQKNGDEFSADISTAPGELQLMAMFEDSRGYYHTFLKYEVN